MTLQSKALQFIDADKTANMLLMTVAQCKQIQAAMQEQSVEHKLEFQEKVEGYYAS